MNGERDYRRALDFEASVTHTQERSERRAWHVAGAAVMVAVLCVVALAVMVPFYRVVPLPIEVDRLTGEAQVIAHCVDAPRWAVLDDLAARRCAAAHDVRVIGTLGVVLRAKNRGQVESARPLVKKLVAAGMFIGDEFVEAVLASVGE